MMAETVLLRVKRQGERWLERPGIRAASQGAGFFGGGLLLAGLEVFGVMQPVAMGLTAACSGWRCWASAAGSAAGYWLFWGEEGLQGVVWTLGALLLALCLPLLDAGGDAGFRLAAGCMCVVSGAGLAFGLAGPQDTGVLLGRITSAGAALLLSRRALAGRDRLSRWLGWGAGVMALTQRLPFLGWLAAGFGASAAPLPAAVAIALGTELGSGAALSFPAAVGLSFYFQRLLPKAGWARYISPGLACAGLMLLKQTWEPGVLLWVSLGGAVGALLPWHFTAVPQPSRVGNAQVRLEQTARVLNRLQRQLLEFTPPPLDVPALTQKLKQNACAACPARTGCLEQNRITEGLLTGDESFQCRKGAQAGAELRRSREQLRRIRAARARQEECRMALVQQYGFLSDTLQELSDQLPQRFPRAAARYRVQVSARSRGRQSADGDRVSAFPGVGCRYYVLLCDGMGTGPGASEESRQAGELITAMLTAGMAPGAALGSVNSQLTLMDRGGAVTVDLAELRLDTGRVWLYKWGAGPSWLLHPKRGVMVGSSGPPPGLGLGTGRESVYRVALSPGDSLVLLSDGVDTAEAKTWPVIARTADPGSLADQILASGAHQGDDATAVVIRLLPHAPPA